MNPYKAIRLQEHLTQKEIARDLGITSQVILRVEQGLFSSPPPELTSYLSPFSGRTEAELRGDYFRWVYFQRNQNASSLPVQRIRTHFSNWNPTLSRRISWKEFRKNILGLSVAATAKLLVIQISLVQDLEKTGRNQQQVKDLLLEWGIPVEAINYDPPNTIKKNNEAIA